MVGWFRRERQKERICGAHMCHNDERERKRERERERVPTLAAAAMNGDEAKRLTNTHTLRERQVAVNRRGDLF
jgi:hypothetical protein